MFCLPPPGPNSWLRLCLGGGGKGLSGHVRCAESVSFFGQFPKALQIYIVLGVLAIDFLKLASQITLYQ